MIPLLLNVPTLIETDRLFLRIPSEPEDTYQINQAIRYSINELKPWLSFAQNKPTLEETEVNRRRALINFHERKSFRFLIFIKQSEQYVGTISFENVDWRVPKAEIGYWLHSAYMNKGYLTEAANALIAFGWDELKLNRIEIRCEPTNTKSRSVTERLGFQLEAILRDADISADGKNLRDTCIYALIKADLSSHNNISRLIYQYEQQLLKRQLSDFETLLAEDFIEYGTSGQIYHKQLLIDSLTNQNQKGDAGIVISQFHCVQLSTDLVQATYQTKEPLNKNRVANRSSLWRRYQDQWQMCFHQGTLVSQDQE